MIAKIDASKLAEETTTTLSIVDRLDQAIDAKNLIDQLHNKIDIVTEGLDKYLRKHLKDQVSRENSEIISEYSLIQKKEMNLSETYRSTTLSVLIVFCKALHNKPLLEITRDDILSYLESLRKPEDIDPLHKWIGSYNLKRDCLAKFFKWLYNPDIAAKDRPIPVVWRNIPRLKRKEQSIYLPSDLWTQEEDFLFLRYCPSKRDRCYHAISRDASARPHEILGMKVRSVHFKLTDDEKQYAEVLVNGKTGSRYIPLIDSIPYLKDWIDSHPQPGNPNALLIPSLNHSTFGRKMSQRAIYMIYKRYKTDFFPRLLEDPNAPPEDKNKIKELLKNPWNPFIRRHSALTEKSKILKEHTLRQHAGWSPRSQMHMKYLHYYGNESSESLLESYGIITKNQQLSKELPRVCPNCNESTNKPDAKFCSKCRTVLSYDCVEEKQHEKESEVHALRNKYEQDMKAMRQEMNQQFKQIMSMIQQNPQLAYIKPEALEEKTKLRRLH